MTTPQLTTSERMIEAATRLFYEKGYAATAVQDVADEIKILKGSLYYYISTKEDLLYQIILGVRQGSLALIDETAAKTDLPAIERLRHYVSANVRYHGEHVMTGAILHREVGSLSEDRQNEFRAHTSRYEDFVAGLIDEAKDDGDIPAAFDSRILTRFIFAIINSVFDWYDPSGPVTPTELSRIYGSLAIDGVRSPSFIDAAT